VIIENLRGVQGEDILANIARKSRLKMENWWWDFQKEVVSKPSLTLEGKARCGSKAERTR